jgi:predicted phosphate transport protein (TIGR00153 family)
MRFWEKFRKPTALRLKEHAQRVEETAEELAKQLRSWIRNEAVQTEVVSEKEHAADTVKREIRLALAKSDTAPLPRDRLLELLWHQDEIADLCQDSALLMALRRPNLGLELEDAFRALGELLTKAVHAYVLAISTFEDAFLSGGLGAKAADIAANVDLVNRLEHESDLVEREIVAIVYRREDLPPFDRYHIVQVVLALGNTVDQVENAAGDLSLLMAAASR